jgi:hypothetical protein
MPSLHHLPPVQCHFVYVVCARLSLRQSLYKFDACGHHREQPGILAQACPLSLLHP